MFTQACFIRKNTPELRKKLKELGIIYFYAMPCLREDTNVLIVHDHNGYYVDTYEDSVFMLSPETQEKFIDCGTNEALFLDLAALRTDSDYMQWFTNADSSCLYLCGTRSWTNSSNIFPSYHKATPAELIEHFKTRKV